MEPMVSIIMPVYKVEDYVAKAIESVQNQTFQDWELLIVDDGSPDESGEICDLYAWEDSRIRSSTRRTAEHRVPETWRWIMRPVNIISSWTRMTGPSRRCWPIW